MNTKLFAFFANKLLAGNFDNVGKILESFLNQWWLPLIGVVSAGGAIIGLTVGVKYILAAQSGDEQKIKQAKNSAIGVFIGIVLIFLITALIPVAVACFKSWYDNDAQEYMSIILSAFAL